MPNWCNNFVEVSHEDPAKIRALADAMNRGEFCSHVIPTPKDLTDTVAGSVPEGAERDAHEAQMRRNVELYGAKDWYDFQTSRWGTKWDVGGDSQADVSDDGKTMSASFDSAWSPPQGVYEELVEQGYQVRAYYYESGMAFCGIWEDGVDDYYELSHLSADQVEDTIPSDLDEMFCISETMREYEEPEELSEWINESVEERKKLGLVSQ